MVERRPAAVEVAAEAAGDEVVAGTGVKGGVEEAPSGGRSGSATGKKQAGDGRRIWAAGAPSGLGGPRARGVGACHMARYEWRWRSVQRSSDMSGGARRKMLGFAP